VASDRERIRASEQPQEPPGDGPEQLVSSLQRASRGLQRLLIAQTRSSGLGMLELMVLLRAAEGSGVTSGDVGRSLGLSTSTMTGLVDRLAEDGLVRRHPHPTDGRLVLIRATAKGRRVRERSVGEILESLTTESARLGAAEAAGIARFLDRVVGLLNQQADELQKAAQQRTGRTGTPRRTRETRSAPST